MILPALFILSGCAAMACLMAMAISSQAEIPPMHRAIRTERLPGDTEEMVYDRLLAASPTHQAQLKEKI